MQLSKYSYYSDFIVYPVVILTVAAVSMTGDRWLARTEWFGATIAGFVLWTLLEYILHRIALHRIAYFASLHHVHHAAPLSFVGTPPWISVFTLGGGIFIPAWWCFGTNAASGLTAGVMIGYWWYGIVHHVIHHGTRRSPHSYFGALQAWHLRHHYSPKGGNFGVTTGLWDHVFGTAIRMHGKTAIMQ
jgi:sterol desaturase/sphingolipid hydroxylase (fatty acid hydroxylase superfamily)